MKFALFFASGQGMIPFLFLGVPSAAIGLVCLSIAVAMALKKKESEKKTVRNLTIVGVLLVIILFISPTMDPVVFWVLDRIMR